MTLIGDITFVDVGTGDSIAIPSAVAGASPAAECVSTSSVIVAIIGVIVTLVDIVAVDSVTTESCITCAIKRAFIIGAACVDIAVVVTGFTFVDVGTFVNDAFDVPRSSFVTSLTFAVVADFIGMSFGWVVDANGVGRTDVEGIHSVAAPTQETLILESVSTFVVVCAINTITSVSVFASTFEAAVVVDAAGIFMTVVVTGVAFIDVNTNISDVTNINMSAVSIGFVSGFTRASVTKAKFGIVVGVGTVGLQVTTGGAIGTLVDVGTGNNCGCAWVEFTGAEDDVFFSTFGADAFVTVVVVAHVSILADGAGLTNVVASGAFVNINTDMVNKFVSVSADAVVTACCVFADAIGVVSFSTDVSSVAFVSVITDVVSVGTFARPFGSTCTSVTTLIVGTGCILGARGTVAFVNVNACVVILSVSTVAGTSELGWVSRSGRAVVAVLLAVVGCFVALVNIDTGGSVENGTVIVAEALI